MKKKIVVPILCLVLVVGMLSGCVEEEPTNEAPTASFTWPENIYVNTEFTFTDASADDTGIATWSWDFDEDGVEDSSEQNPTYTYITVGDKTVKLTVTDGEGETSEYSATITVSYMPPTAMFTYDPMVNITTETPITFTDNSTAGDANITTWAWDFGDGNTSNETNYTHTYAAAGTYTVTLTVTDENGETDTTEEITIDVT